MFRKKGFSLIEMLLVISVTFLLFLSIFFVYNKVELNSNSTIEINNIRAIYSNVKQLYLNSNSYKSLSDLTKDKTFAGLSVIYPENVINHSHTKGSKEYHAVNQFNGDIETFGSDNYFTIRENNIPDAACTKIVISLFNDFEGVNINGVIVKAYDKYNSKKAYKLDINAISSACVQGQSQPYLIFSSYYK